MIAPKGFREILQISGEQALLYIERISYSQLGLPVEMRHLYFRADSYALHMNLIR
jgi:DNA-binding GntR family transcriptional regulator